MKTRIGFVSNSSSASFVIVWKDKTERSLKAAIAKMYDLYHFDVENDKFSWEKYDDTLKRLTDRIVKDRLGMNEVSERKTIVDRNDCEAVAREFLESEKSVVGKCNRMLERTRGSKGTYITTLFTTMYNDYTSFGAEDIVLPIVMDSNFELIEAYVED